LSRPYRLGSGEVLPIDSTLALAFYKIFIFEPQYGLKVPHFDWEIEETDLIDQLSAIEDDHLHEILQRELLAYRKLFYSVGQTDQAEKLLAVYEHVYIDHNSRLENSATLLELGAQPWVYLPMPGMTQIVILVLFFLAVISMLLSWPMDFVIARVRSRKAKAAKTITETSKATRTSRLAATLIVVTYLLVIFLYVSCIASYPDSGELVWHGGTMLAKALIILANLSALLSILLLVLAIKAWIFEYWNTAWRIHYTLIALTIFSTVFVWQAMGFLGWG
jgi:hypothetical protein